jgi:Sulfotransferase family
VAARAGNRLVLIGGVNRSGTTLVRQLLGSHSRLALPPTELNLFRRLVDADRPIRDRKAFLELLDEVLAWPKLADWALDAEDVRAAALDAEPSYAGLFTTLVDAYRRSIGKDVAGEKTTGYELRLATLDEWLGERYVFFHLVRRPLDVYASLRWYTGSDTHTDPGQFAAAWNESARIAVRMAATRPDRYALVRYEDVVDDPAAFARRACGLIGIEPEVERMLAMVDFDVKDNSSFAPVRGGADYDGTIRRRDDVDRADRVPAEARRVVERRCRELAQLLGYAPLEPASTARRSVLARLGARR